MKLFVDASAWIALADENDQHHAAAQPCLEGFPAGVQLHTSNYVVAEAITRIRYQAGPDAAWRWAEALRQNPGVRIHYADRSLDDQALRAFRKYADQSLSFADCSTIVLMGHLGLDRILAFDDDFRKLGFEVVPSTGR